MIVTVFRFHLLFRLEECTTISTTQWFKWLLPCFDFMSCSGWRSVRHLQLSNRCGHPVLHWHLWSHHTLYVCFCFLFFVFCFRCKHGTTTWRIPGHIDINKHNQQNYEAKRAFKQYTVQNSRNTTRKGTLGARNGALLRSALGTLRLGRWVVLSVPRAPRCPEPREFAPHRLECHPEPHRQLEKKWNSLKFCKK